MTEKTIGKTTDMSDYVGYVAVITTVEGGYFVEFPDLEGCITQGSSIEEAICRAQNALAIYYTEKKGCLPVASALESVRAKYQNSIVQMIVINTKNCIVKPVHVVNKTLTIPEWLNTLAIQYKVNCSQILKNALIAHLKNMDSVSIYDRNMLND